MKLCHDGLQRVLRCIAFSPITPARQVRQRRTCFCLSVLLIGLCGVARADDSINERWPIKGPESLSPPHVEPTNECSKKVYVDSFIPHATVKVFLNGTILIGGPVAPNFGFAAIQLSQKLHAGDKVTATQTVNGFTSQPSAVMIVGQMPATLPAPSVDPKIYACGRIVPVHGLTPGVDVEVRDIATNSVIGNDATPNDWGSTWDPVFTSALVSAHQITANQSACTGVKSPNAPARPVLSAPNPPNPPILDSPIIGNDAITAHRSLYRLIAASVPIGHHWLRIQYRGNKLDARLAENSCGAGSDCGAGPLPTQPAVGTTEANRQTASPNPSRADLPWSARGACPR